MFPEMVHCVLQTSLFHGVGTESLLTSLPSVRRRSHRQLPSKLQLQRSFMHPVLSSYLSQRLDCEAEIDIAGSRSYHNDDRGSMLEGSQHLGGDLHTKYIDKSSPCGADTVPTNMLTAYERATPAGPDKPLPCVVGRYTPRRRPRLSGPVNKKHRFP